MAELTASAYKRLYELGRSPSLINANIWFGGNEALQKAPGRHHLKEFQATGTYNHPQVAKERQQRLKDLVRRLSEGKMNAVTYKNKIGNLQQFLQKCADNDVVIKQEALEQLYTEAELLDNDVAEARRNAPPSIVDNTPPIDVVRAANNEINSTPIAKLENSDAVVEL